MKNFSDLLSPLSYLMVCVSCYFGLYTIFRPGLAEYSMALVIDLLAIIPIVMFQERLFLRMYPEYVGIFPRWSLPETLWKDPDAAKALVSSLYKYPRRRALDLFFWSFAKAIPGGALVIFYWRRTHSAWIQAGSFFVFEMLCMSFFYALVYLENSDFVSKFVREAHKRHDLSSVFEDLRLSESNVFFRYRESLAILCIFTWTLSLACIVLFSRRDEVLSSGVILSILGVLFLGFSSILRIYYLIRMMQHGTQEEILSKLSHLGDHSHDHPIIAVGSVPEIASLQDTYNKMTRRLMIRDREIGEWAARASEKSRFEALGEVSGLVAHDLSAPLQVVDYCAEELLTLSSEGVGEPVSEREQSRALSRLKQLAERLRFSAATATELVQSLRTYLKNPDQTTPSSNLLEATDYARQFLRWSNGYKSSLKEMKIQVDPKLRDLYVGCPRVDLIHVFINLFQNSLDNFSHSGRGDGRISISLVSVKEGKIVLWLEDNGTGLSPEDFEAMTARWGGALTKPRKGLGLRLTRSLLERYRGRMRALSSGVGCRLELTLPHCFDGSGTEEGKSESERDIHGGEGPLGSEARGEFYGEKLTERRKEGGVELW